MQLKFSINFQLGTYRTNLDVAPKPFCESHPKLLVIANKSGDILGSKTACSLLKESHFLVFVSKILCTIGTLEIIVFSTCFTHITPTDINGNFMYRMSHLQHRLETILAALISNKGIGAEF